MSHTLSPIATALFALILLTLLVAAAWWVMRASVQGDTMQTDRADIDVYVDQVTEIERDFVQGRISGEAAEAGRLEIGRRLVKAQNREIPQGRRVNSLVLAGIAAGISLLAGGLYFVAGSPGRSDVPFNARERELLARDPATLTQDEILVLLQERARLNPDDPRPHVLMGQVFSAAGRDQDALRAYQAVLRRTPNDAEAVAEAAGILMRLNDNVMGEDAKAALDAALKINPKSPAARFYLGLSDWQNGRKDEAFAAWKAAYTAVDDQPEARLMLATRVVQVLSHLDRGPTSSGPIQGSSRADQSAFISQMIANRQARLAAEPNDLALRFSLVRVLVMSGQSEAARAQLLAGIERADDQPFTFALYEVAARSLPQIVPNVTKR